MLRFVILVSIVSVLNFSWYGESLASSLNDKEEIPHEKSPLLPKTQKKKRSHSVKPIGKVIWDEIRRLKPRISIAVGEKKLLNFFKKRVLKLWVKHRYDLFLRNMRMFGFAGSSNELFELNELNLDALNKAIGLEQKDVEAYLKQNLGK